MHAKRHGVATKFLQIVAAATVDMEVEITMATKSKS